jgi:transcriptional regulator with XRE-family HTH domain
MDVRKRIGWNVRRLRRERDITQEEFANDSGFDRGYISGVERGVRNPSALVLARMANALGADVSELFDAAAALRVSQERDQG